MKLPESTLKQIEKLAAEGRVTEGGRPVLPDLVAALLPLDVDEKQFQQAVVDLARREGWLVYHTYDSRRCEPGYPDLTMVKHRVVWMELKVPPNKPTAEQQNWIEAIKATGQTVYVFYPEHWPVIKNILEGCS